MCVSKVGILEMTEDSTDICRKKKVSMLRYFKIFHYEVEN